MIRTKEIVELGTDLKGWQNGESQNDRISTSLLSIILLAIIFALIAQVRRSFMSLELSPLRFDALA